MSSFAFARRRRLLWMQFGLGALVLLTGSGGSCSDGERPQTTPPIVEAQVREADLPAPNLRLLVMTDLDGYLEPCGCTSRPLGGIDRMAARVAALRQGDTPTLFVSAGNLFFHGAPHGGDAERAASQERMRADALVGILNRLDLAAAAPGPLDFSYGTETFGALSEAAQFPLLAAGVQLDGPSGPRGLAPSASITAGGIDVGLVGLTAPRGPDGALLAGVTAEDLRAAGRSAVAALRAGGADLVVALTVGDRRTARGIATGIEGIDFVVHGGLDEAEVGPPTQAGGAVMVGAGRQGQGLVVLELRRRGDGEWTDASVWTREEERSHVEESIRSLRTRIHEWEHEASASPEDVAAQRARLGRMEREARALIAPPTVEGNVFTARYEELVPEAERDGAVTRAMGQLDRRVNQHNRVAFADWIPEAPADGEPRYLGSQTCASCHSAAFAWWQGHAHGNAYETLERQSKNFNLSCVGCHVTGYLRPGGSTVTHVEGLKDVGCESCHGPGSAHVNDPTGAAFNVTRAPEESTCVGCHNADHSDRFEFDAYRQMLIAPGHGAPAAR